MPKISVLTPTIRPAGLEITRAGLIKQYFRDFEWLVDINCSGEHDLNAAYNRMLRRATGELIVSLQDWITVSPDYLQRFWDAYQAHPKTMFTAPVGKVDDLVTHTNARWDWRAYEDAKPQWDCWEIDSGAAPLKMFYEVGGFDEYLDQWWSFDNVSVAKRASIFGWGVMNVFNNPSLALDHDKREAHPFRDRFRPALVKMRMESYETSPKLSFL